MQNVIITLTSTVTNILERLPVRCVLLGIDQFENFSASIRSIRLFLTCCTNVYILQILFDQGNYGSLGAIDDIVTKLVAAQVKSLESLVQELQSAVCVTIIVFLLGVFLSCHHIILMVGMLQIKIANVFRKDDEDVQECVSSCVSRQKIDTKSLQVGWWANPFYRRLFGRVIRDCVRIFSS